MSRPSRFFYDRRPITTPRHDVESPPLWYYKRRDLFGPSPLTKIEREYRQALDQQIIQSMGVPPAILNAAAYVNPRSL